MNCLCSQWEEIHGFQYPKEYDSFVQWIDGHVQNGGVKEIPARDQEKHATLKERWFQCGECSSVWRLVAHDFPFEGLFSKVDK